MRERERERESEMSAAVSPAPFERSRNQESNLVRLSYTCCLYLFLVVGSC